MIKKFADDTKGLKVIKDDRDWDCLQRTLDNLAGWAKDWGMKFNIPKCKIMHVGTHNRDTNTKWKERSFKKLLRKKT